MIYNTTTFRDFHVSDFISKMLNWSDRFNIFCLLNSNGFTSKHGEWELIFAADPAHILEIKDDQFVKPLQQFSNEHEGWIFGHLNYPDQTNDRISFPNGFFFVPKILIRIKGNEVIISSKEEDPELIYDQLMETAPLNGRASILKEEIKSEMNESEYHSAINAIKEHLQKGDCYEINFCQEFYSENADIHPASLYHQLIQSSPSPFSAFYRLKEKFCISASPERFLKKKADRLISQPIKGTSKRNLIDAEKDLIGRQYLKESQKEKSENVMIVDLVRNDLSKVSARGSVEVEELMGIYSFPQVHQMISTVVSILDNRFHWTEALDACFPMGSMTGAPKKRVMELINTYEKTARGLFSGTIGYVDPQGDFDFNVVIRSYFYDRSTKKLSFKAGGGITINSNPEQEYKESLLKVEILRKLLEPEKDKP
ncbi:MAG: hypothetical protein RIR96_1666 [Bacteroidota bacterium]